MINKSLQSTKNDWIRRIVVLLRRADARQLRDIYYMIKGYLGPCFPGTGSAGPEEDRVQVQ